MKLTIALLSLFALPLGSASVVPTLFTDPVSADADDPAIWVHPKDPAKSIIFGTDKLKEKGGIYAFNLDGKITQRIENLNRPNNCDVEYGLGGKDIVVVTERLEHRLRIFSIDRETGKLSDVSGKAEVFGSETDKSMREVMGVGLYRDPKSNRVFAFVSRSKGPTSGYLGQYELVANGEKIDAKPVRTFGTFSGKKEIESVFVDDELGFVYYSDETVGTRKYAIASLEQPVTGPDTSAFKGDHEGIALYATGKGKGYIVCTDQIAGASVYHLFDRVSGKPVGFFEAGLDDTDGIEVVSAPLGSKFPKGMFVGMNSQSKNFGVVNWLTIGSALKLAE